MKFVMYQDCVSPHQLPLARELVARLGAENFRYVYRDRSQRERVKMGWTMEGDGAWCVHLGSAPDEARRLVEEAEVLLTGMREVDLFERRAARGLKTFYQSERWFKPVRLFGFSVGDRPICLALPGWIRLLVPGYWRMARRFAKLLGEPSFRYLPIGPWAAKDMTLAARVCGVSGGAFLPWGYFVAPSTVPQSNSPPNQQSDDSLRVLWVGRPLWWKRVDTIRAAVARVPGASLDVFTGIPIARVREEMRRHDVYVLASNAFEGWGAVVSEALAEGMCALGTHEAGSSAALLPEDRLFHAGDWRTLAKKLSDLARLKAEGRPLPKTPLPRDFTPAGAAAKLLRTVAALTVSLLCLTAAAEPAPGNLLRNADFSSRTAYGLPLGWEVFLGGATNFSCRTLGGGVAEVTFYGKKKDVFLSQVPVTLKSGGRYRYSVEVMTDGLDGARATLTFWDAGWRTTRQSSAFPQDTKGAWVPVVWEGEAPVNRNNRAYNFALECSGARERGPTVFRIRNLRLEALDAESAAAAAPLPAKYMRDPEARIVPVSHRLAQLPQDAFELSVYWPGRPVCGLERARLCATLEQRALAGSAFDGSGHATVRFGRNAPGAHRLALTVRDPDGAVLASNDYRVAFVAPPPTGAVGRRLNNFVTELCRVPLANREVRFFRPARSWVWINLGFARDNPGAEAFLDRQPLPVVRARPHESRLETMREVGPGWHTLRVTGVAKEAGELRVNAVGTLFGEARYFDDRTCSFIQAYVYSLAFERRFMWGVCNTLNGRRLWKAGEFERGFYAERGMKIVDSVVLPSNDPRRYDREACYAHLTGQGWTLDMDLEIDENATGAAFLNHLNTAENLWRMQDERPKQRICVDWCDNMDYAFDNPVNSVSEIAAIVNSGGGTGFLVPECYEAAGRTPEDSDRYMNNFARYVRSAIDFVPAAKGAVNLYMATYFDPGDYNPYACPSTDLKAMYARMFRQFATWPVFAENQGTAMGGSLRGEEEIRRWGARCLRHYCLEGNTNDLAEAYGYRWTPGFVDNCDFERGLAGWTSVPAKGGAIAPETIPGYGRKQARISPHAARAKWNFGDTAAVFTAADGGTNRLERKIAGLEPGRHYALLFVGADYGDILDPQGGWIRPSALTAELAGAEEVKGLYFRHVVQFLRDSAKRTKLNVYRYVFRARGPEATLVFRDADRAGKTLAPGTRQALNYVVFRPYYVEDDAEVAEIAELIAGCDRRN